jgi:hypothetical protein
MERRRTEDRKNFLISQYELVRSRYEGNMFPCSIQVHTIFTVALYVYINLWRIQPIENAYDEW